MADLCHSAALYVLGHNPDLTVRQIALLGMICDEPGHSTGPLAKTLGLSKPVVTRACKTLASMALIRLEQRADDRRKIAILPTGSGLHLRLTLGCLGSPEKEQIR